MMLRTKIKMSEIKMMVDHISFSFELDGYFVGADLRVRPTGAMTEHRPYIPGLTKTQKSK